MRATLRTHSKVARATVDGYVKELRLILTEGQLVNLHAAYYLEAIRMEQSFQWQWRKRNTPLTDEQLRKEQIRHRRIKRQALAGEF